MTMMIMAEWMVFLIGVLTCLSSVVVVESMWVQCGECVRAHPQEYYCQSDFVIIGVLHQLREAPSTNKLPVSTTKFSANEVTGSTARPTTTTLKSSTTTLKMKPTKHLGNDPQYAHQPGHSGEETTSKARPETTSPVSDVTGRQHDVAAINNAASTVAMTHTIDAATSDPDSNGSAPTARTTTSNNNDNRTDVTAATASSNPIFHVTVRKVFKGHEFVSSSTRPRLLRIQDDFSGSEYCGLNITEGEPYLVTGQFVHGELYHHAMCDWAEAAHLLSKAQRTNLKHMYKKYCNVCQARSDVLPHPMPLNLDPQACSYNPTVYTQWVLGGTDCEGFHSTCVKQPGQDTCSWLQTSAYRECVEHRSLLRPHLPRPNLPRPNLPRPGQFPNPSQMRRPW